MERRIGSRRGLAGAIGVLALLTLAPALKAAALNPPSLTATAISTSQIRLNWNDPNPNETGYQIERSLYSSSGFALIATAAKNATTYTNSGLASGTTYYYRVRAVKTNGGTTTSVYSNVASARTFSSASSVPAAPSNLAAAAASSSQINLSWSDNSTNETGFKVERATSSAGPWTQIGTTTARTFYSTGLAASTTYYFRVRAYNAYGNSAYSNTAWAKTLAASSLPAAPSSLSATSVSTSQINLSWSDNSANETGFKVERATSSAGPWAQIGTTAGKTYYSTGLAASTTYYFRVRAYNGYGNSAYSNTAWATTQAGTSLPAAPSSLSATTASASQINLAWLDNSGNESGFKIERSTATSGWAQIATVGSNVRTYSSTGLAASTTYSYRVRAYNTSGDSGYSNTASATTQSAVSGGGAHVWSKDFGGPGLSDSAIPAALAVDNAGASVVLGQLQWRTDFGGGLLTSAGSWDIYLAKYAANGSHLWSKRFGGAEDDRPKGVAVDSAGNIFITGLFRGSVDFGGGVRTAPAFTANAFLAKYSPNGDHLWSLRLGTGPCEGMSVAVDGSGNVILAGNFYTTSDFGGGALTTAGGSDIVLAKYSSSGGHLWSRQIGGASDDSALRVAADTTTGEIVMTGYFGGSVNFGGASLTSAGMTDIFLAKYSSSGSHVWSRRWGGTLDDKGYGVALDQLGNAVVTGVFTGNVDFGGGALTNPGGGDIFLVKYSVDGAHIWSRGYGSTTSVTDVGCGVDFDSAGRVLLTGSVGATIDFGGGPLTGDGWTNPILAKFGSDGAHIWSKRYSGGGAHANGKALAVDAADNVLATGDFNSSVNLGGASLTSPGGADTYLVKLGP